MIAEIGAPAMPIRLHARNLFGAFPCDGFQYLRSISNTIGDVIIPTGPPIIPPIMAKVSPFLVSDNGLPAFLILLIFVLALFLNSIVRRVSRLRLYNV